MSAALDDITSGNWRVRRPLVLATLAFCGAQLAYLTIWGQDTGLAQTLAIGAYGLAGSTLGSYLFAATWDSKNFIMANSRAQQPMGGFQSYGQPYGQGYPSPYQQPPLYDQNGQPMQPMQPVPTGNEKPL